MSLFGDKLQMYMNQKGITRKELADRLNVSIATIGFYITGRNEPKLDTLISIATALEVSIDDLLDYVPGEYERIKNVIESIPGKKYKVEEDPNKNIIITGDNLIDCVFLHKLDFCTHFRNVENEVNELSVAIRNKLFEKSITEYDLIGTIEKFKEKEK